MIKQKSFIRQVLNQALIDKRAAEQKQACINFHNCDGDNEKYMKLYKPSLYDWVMRVHKYNRKMWFERIVESDCFSPPPRERKEEIVDFVKRISDEIIKMQKESIEVLELHYDKYLENAVIIYKEK